MQRLWVDLHIHTVLSPCAEIEMIPPLIIRRAQELDLGIIAITDHNCAANVEAVIAAARGTGIAVLPGMEVQTREEVHMLCLFDTLEQSKAWQDQVTAALPDARNREAFFGAQYVVDDTGDYQYTEERLLATSTTMSVEQVVAGVNALAGICLPAHIDRPSFSILSNLGFIPPALPIAGIELSPHNAILAKFVLDQREMTKNSGCCTKEHDFSACINKSFPLQGDASTKEPGLTTPRKLVELLPDLVQHGVIVDSDAHRLADMSAHTRVQIASPTVSELRMALSGQQARYIDLISP
jgi:PHP domain-containing protein